MWFRKPLPLNADLDRHRAKLRELNDKIATASPEAARVYTDLRNKLMQSYAELADKLGRQ